MATGFLLIPDHTPRLCERPNPDLGAQTPSSCPSRRSSRTSPASSRRWSWAVLGCIWDNDARSTRVRISRASYLGR